MKGKSLPMRTKTACVHAGTYHDPITRGVNTPIYTSSSFEFLGRDDSLYPRYFNTPNQDAVVRKLAALEGAEDGVLFSSGMAAMSTAILAFTGSGDHIVMQDELYGGTHALATGTLERLGVACSFVPTDAAGVAAALTAKTKVVIIESPTNPLLNIIDIRRVAGSARRRGVLTIMDNTFATPINQMPLSLGIDIVVHSGTKYLGGHSDLCCGAVLTSRDYAARIREVATHLGGSLNAISCHLLERSLKTLAVRVERQTMNALAIAEFLSRHPAVSGVNYPGLPSAPGHAIAKRQMKGFGGMLSFELDSARISPQRFLKRLRIIRPAGSLGGVETIICAPARTSHAKISAEERRRIGISDGLLRLSTGIESADDLIADLKDALPC